jgi:hypothetical protein
MGKLIRDKPDEGETQSETSGAASIFVNGARYANAAAKFWSSLIDEVSEDFPKCSSIELSASSSGALEHDLLFPQRALEKDLDHLVFADVEAMMKETIAEIEILGPPAPVQIRLLAGQDEIYSGSLPLDCVDAEIFPYLVVWPLSWAEIPDGAWNNESVSGEIEAQDRRRHIVYKMFFILTTTHLSEGLFRRSIAVTPSVAMLA